MEKKRYNLRPHFTIVQGKDTHAGPKAVDLTDQEAKDNAHKIEEFSPTEVPMNEFNPSDTSDDDDSEDETEVPTDGKKKKNK
jgi:hypothetical protein